jgi:endonuclease/exonuclease/phosphatase family metal-dependent hydrolase
MRSSTARCAAYTCLAVLAVSALGCDRVKRETKDRVTPHQPSTWTSASDCEALLPKPARSSSRSPRIGTWNIRYFPDGREEPQPDAAAATDVRWLACAIASLDVDVLAIQEFKATPQALQKQRELVASLNQLTSGAWRIELASSPPPDVQHPGFLYDTRRVAATHVRDIPGLNPLPVCNNEASPGFGGYFRIEGGPDFHLIAVHLPAGDRQKSADDRNVAISRMPKAIEEALSLARDEDVILAGDFNTSGCEDCAKTLPAKAELMALEKTVAAQKSSLRLLAASESCTWLDDADAVRLDHFIVSRSSKAVAGAAVAHVSGICKETRCARLREWLVDARERLSDHCPVTLDLAEQDRD